MFKQVWGFWNSAFIYIGLTCSAPQLHIYLVSIAVINDYYYVCVHGYEGIFITAINETDLK